jgi:hypothetical protein
MKADARNSAIGLFNLVKVHGNVEFRTEAGACFFRFHSLKFNELVSSRLVQTVLQYKAVYLRAAHFYRTIELIRKPSCVY